MYRRNKECEHNIEEISHKKRILVNRRRGWEDSIKICYKEIVCEYVECIELT
jgi:hypothetical protein